MFSGGGMLEIPDEVSVTSNHSKPDNQENSQNSQDS